MKELTIDEVVLVAGGVAACKPGELDTQVVTGDSSGSTSGQHDGFKCDTV